MHFKNSHFVEFSAAKENGNPSEVRRHWLTDFSAWMDAQLRHLEERHADFVTRNSLQRHFSGAQQRRSQPSR